MSCEEGSRSKEGDRFWMTGAENYKEEGKTVYQEARSFQKQEFVFSFDKLLNSWNRKPFLNFLREQ